MGKEDNPAPVLNYAGKDSIRLATPWYVIVAGLFFCLPLAIPTFFCIQLVSDICYPSHLADDVALLILSGGLCAIPVAVAYRGIVCRSRRAAEALCWLAAVPAGLFTIITFFVITTSPMPGRYRLWSGIAMCVAFFLVMSLRRWCDVLNRTNIKKDE